MPRGCQSDLDKIAMGVIDCRQSSLLAPRLHFSGWSWSAVEFLEILGMQSASRMVTPVGIQQKSLVMKPGFIREIEVKMKHTKVNTSSQFCKTFKGTLLGL